MLLQRGGLTSSTQRRHVARAERQRLSHLDQPRQHLLGATDEYHARDRHAALPGRAEAGGDERLERRVGLCVVEHHGMVLRAQVGLHALAVGRTCAASGARGGCGGRRR